MADVKTSSKNVGDLVLARVDAMCQTGFVLPKDYNVTNAIKASMLVLQDVKDKNGKPALEVCTPNSIQTALFQMIVKGIDVSKQQGYFVAYGSQLQLQESYFGKVLRVKRIFPNWNPSPVLVHEGDSFKYAVDAETGRKYLVEHTQSMENLDKKIVGGYLYLPCADGGKDLFVMTAKMIATAHSKSRSGGATAKEFPEKMYAKTLVSSGCTMILNSTPSNAAYADNDDDPTNPHVNNDDVQDVEEVVDAPNALPEAPANADPDTGEIHNNPAVAEQSNGSDF